MKAATLIILLLSNHGYWLSNQAGTVTVQSTATKGLPQADLVWQLMIASVPLANGKVAMSVNDKPATIDIKCPQVRVRTNVRFVYQLIQRDGGKELEHGEVALQLFPADLMSGWTGLLRDKQVAVIDASERLPKLLDTANVPNTRYEDASKIDHAEVILVGEDQLDDSPFGQAALMALAEHGSGVMIFRQPKPAQLAGYPLAARPAPTKLAWKLDHPLFDRFSEPDVQSWLVAGENLQAIQLPADEPVLELAYWPRETPGIKPAPIEAVAAVKSVGTGRIVLFEIPLGDCQQDPRSQILLGNALAYLLTPPQPTLKPSERELPKPGDAKDGKLGDTKKEETKLSGDH